MDKIEVLKALSVFAFLAILFTPQNSNTWLYFFIPGIVFGIVWFRMLD